MNNPIKKYSHACSRMYESEEGVWMRVPDNEQAIKALEDKISELEIEEDVSASLAEEQSRLIHQLREGVQEIYAKRGEDMLIAGICNRLIDISR